MRGWTEILRLSFIVSHRKHLLRGVPDPVLLGMHVSSSFSNTVYTCLGVHDVTSKETCGLFLG